MTTFVVLKQATDSQAPTVKPGDTIHLHYQASVLSTGEVIENTFELGKPRTVVVGTDKLTRGLLKGIIAMKKGMKINMTATPEMAYGVGGVPGKVPPNSNVMYIIEIADHFPKSVSTSPAEEKKN
jgi:FKBP-type peptidyl-prolyl cis-trans isomerase